MLNGDCRGLERDSQGQSEPRKGLGEPRGEGPALCHPGLASSLPRCADRCPSAFLQQVPGTSRYIRRANTSMFTEKTERAAAAAPSIKGAEFF